MQNYLSAFITIIPDSILPYVDIQYAWKCLKIMNMLDIDSLYDDSQMQKNWLTVGLPEQAHRHKVDGHLCRPGNSFL